MDRYPYHLYNILLGATRALAHIGVHIYTSRFQPVTRHAKAREFLELRQGAMIVLEYVAKFIELARFEDGLKLSIRGKIVGFLLQDMDFMVRTTMVIEREIDDIKNIQDAGASWKKKESQPSSSTGKKQRTSTPTQF